MKLFFFSVLFLVLNLIKIYSCTYLNLVSLGLNVFVLWKHIKVCSQSTNHATEIKKEAPITSSLLLCKKEKFIVFSRISFSIFLRILRPEMNPFVILLFLYGWYHLKKNSFMRNSLFFFSLQTLCFFPFLYTIFFSLW